MPSIIDEVVASFKAHLPEKVTGEAIVEAAAEVQKEIAAMKEDEAVRKKLCEACQTAAEYIAMEAYAKKADVVEAFEKGLASEYSPSSRFGM